MEDTEWTDILKKHGIIKDEPKVDETQVEEIIPQNEKKDLINSDEDLLELDDDDEQIIREYRNKRMAEIKANLLVPQFGDVREITAPDYVEQVNKAGDNIWVVLFLYQPGNPECTQLSQIISQLAIKFKTTKFLKSIASLCVANFPESSLPAIFIYQNGCLKKQLIGSHTFGGKNMTLEIVEWLLSQVGAVVSQLEKDPRIGKQSKKFYEQYEDNDDL